MRSWSAKAREGTSMHRTRPARHRTTYAHHWLRRAFLTVGMASALTGTFAVTTVSAASAALCDPGASIEIQMSTSNASGCTDAGGGGGSIEPDPIVQVLVKWVVTAPDGVIISGSSTEDVSGGSGSDIPVPIDLIDLSGLGDAAGKKCRPGDGWDVKSYYEAQTRFYTAFKYHNDFTYLYDCKDVTNVYNFKVYPSDVMGWQGWEFQGHETPPTGVSTFPKPTVSIIGQGKFAQCLPTPIGQYCANKTTVTISWNAFGSGARPKGSFQRA